MNHSTATLLAIAVAMAGLTACSDPEPDPTATSTPTVTATTTDPTPSQSPSPDPTTQTPEPTETLDPHQIAARDIVDEFFRISEALKRDPSLPLQPLADITTGQTQIVYLKEIQDYRALGAVRTGELIWGIESLGGSAERDSEVVVPVVACSDGTNADMVDQASDESILPLDRKPIVRWSIEAVTENGIWKIGDLTSTTVEECEL